MIFNGWNRKIGSVVGSSHLSPWLYVYVNFSAFGFLAQRSPRADRKYAIRSRDDSASFSIMSAFAPSGGPAFHLGRFLVLHAIQPTRHSTFWKGQMKKMFTIYRFVA